MQRTACRASVMAYRPARCRPRRADPMATNIANRWTRPRLRLDVDAGGANVSVETNRSCVTGHRERATTIPFMLFLSLRSAGIWQ